MTPTSRSKRAADEGRADDPPPLAPGLHLVATPIGAAGDVTLRALDILARADILAAEDTRRTGQLLAAHGIDRGDRRMVAYHDHNAPAKAPWLIAQMREGASVALVSDAGTPLVADPGWRLARMAIDAGVPVRAAPGASALLAALAVAGLPTDRFLFAGFPPVKTAERARWLDEFARVPATLVFYEAPHRLPESVAAMAEAFGDRPAAICRELTKTYEEVRRDGLAGLSAALAAEGPPKGEIVVVVGPPAARAAGQEEIDAALRAALGEHSVKDAAALVAQALGAPRKDIYRRALALAGAR